MAAQTYECQHCRQRLAVAESGKAPDCCGHPMTVMDLDNCTLAATAEHSRLDNTNDPCDDGRAG